ncbi:uncharacterized protein LOC118482710 [Helianthus annuus]|nr:uncharacterized protein LOC118482710 [Helianthus annuus]
MDRGSLWKRVVWAIHNNSRSWSFIPAKLSLAGPWKQIKKLSDDFEAMGINLELMFKGYPGSEKQMLFWKERWLFDVPLCEKYPLIFQLETNKNALIRDRVIEGDAGRELFYSWVRLPTSVAETDELDSLSVAVMGFEFGLGADRWVWKLEDSGIFSVNSVRNKLQHNVFSDLRLEFEWNNWSPIKVNFLVWRLIQDKVPTTMALTRRNVVVTNSRCRMCDEEDESALHLFGSCRVADQIWEFISRWCRIRSIFILELSDLANIHKRNRGSERWKKAVSMVTQAAIWVIWRSRNDAVFNGKHPNVSRMKEEIKMLGYMWLKSRVKLENLAWVNWCNFDLYALGV